MNLPIFGAVDGSDSDLRVIHPQWNYKLVAASIAVSLIGAFTSTQLMCSARVAKTFFAAAVWTVLGSSVFGFCGIWCLHEVAMLACELDVQIGINVPLTTLSALLPTIFTCIALGSGPFWERYYERERRKRRAAMKSRRSGRFDRQGPEGHHDLLATTTMRDGYFDATYSDAEHGYRDDGENEHDRYEMDDSSESGLLQSSHRTADLKTPAVTSIQEDMDLPAEPSAARLLKNKLLAAVGHEPSRLDLLDDHISESNTRTTSSDFSSSATSFGLGNMLKGRSAIPKETRNIFAFTLSALYAGTTIRNAVNAFWWSLAITSMHYSGMMGLEIPEGFIIFNPFLVLLSATIAWVVSLVGCILMQHMETNLKQQLLFSVVAASGVAAKHFTGMLASTFVTRAPPSVKRGYPPELATAVASIAIITCLAANLLLAHTATITRDKLAEIVMTRKELWRTIAQKESAEAAAVARSDFIASASHEIRTPLHHLQGYSDLLARTPLSDEGRLLLHAIQGATKTLSSITNNVLDWSRIENDSEAPYRPVNFEIRTLCESIVNLLPNKDEEAEVELFIVVKPRVPRTVYLDEAYVYRIFMNLLSNSLKFTKSGYILVIVDVLNEDLVVTVRDTGCGIPPSFMSRLFEPFSQAQTRSMSRGTGLGLSIIKQLLQKMNGNIEVTSQYDKEVAPGKNGSCFVVTMPLDASNLSLAEEPEVGSSLRRVAILKTNEDDRAVEGLNTAWENFGFEAAVVDGVEGLRESTWTYVWADLARLGTDAAERATLFDDPTRTILIPFDTRNDLDGLPNILDLPHVVPLQKPLRWHTFLDRVTAARERSSNRIPTVRTVRFAADAAEEAGKEMPSTKPAPKCFTILVVEDNPINQKLARKMLTSLGYGVLSAVDGQEGVEMTQKHDLLIDAVLMDQSMPRKDGVTATKEIRAMEATGALVRKGRPIIAVTAVVGPHATAMCKEAGMDDFLPKPLSLAKLEAALSSYLGGNNE